MMRNYLNLRKLLVRIEPCRRVLRIGALSEQRASDPCGWTPFTHTVAGHALIIHLKQSERLYGPGQEGAENHESLS